MNIKYEVVAVDMGAGAFKTFTSDQQSALILAQVAIDSPHVLNVPQLVGIDNQRDYHHLRFVDERGTLWHLYAGSGAYRQGQLITSLDHYRFRGRSDIRALLYASLAELAYQKMSSSNVSEQTPIEIEIERLIVGLPLESWRQSTGQEESTEEEDTPRSVQRWLSRSSHSWESRVGSEGPMVSFNANFAQVQVLPQAMGAVYDFVIDSDYSIKYKLRTKRLGVISIGFNTVDLMAIEEGKPNDQLARSHQTGVRHLLRQYDRSETFSIYELDEKIRRRNLDSNRLNPATRIWLETIDAFLADVWHGNTMRRFDDVIITGGGVLLPGVREFFQRHPLLKSKVRFPEDPVFAIARGLCKIGVLNQRRAS